MRLLELFECIQFFEIGCNNPPSACHRFQSYSVDQSVGFRVFELTVGNQNLQISNLIR